MNISVNRTVTTCHSSVTQEFVNSGCANIDITEVARTLEASNKANTTKETISRLR